MTILVTGSRDWMDHRRIVTRLLEEPDGTVIIEGGNKQGADYCARMSAYAIGFKVITVLAKWDRYGRRAGPIRNRQMLDMKPDMVLAFRKNMSRGTTDCINEAMHRGITTEVIDVEC